MSTDSVVPEEIEQSLSIFAGLPANWDSYGAIPISAVALTAARNTVAYVEAQIESKAHSVWLSPEPDGTINITWSFSKGAELYVEPGDSGTFRYLITVFGLRGEESETEGELQDLTELDAILATI